jgi:hypothetical protein
MAPECHLRVFFANSELEGASSVLFSWLAGCLLGDLKTFCSASKNETYFASSLAPYKGKGSR